MVTAVAQMPGLGVPTVGTVEKGEYSRVRSPVDFSPWERVRGRWTKG